MVFVAKAFFFDCPRIFGISTNSIPLSRRLLRVKLVGLVCYIPIGAVSSVVLYIDQGGVLINPQRKVDAVDIPFSYRSACVQMRFSVIVVC
jgi:hypothetical protein